MFFTRVSSQLILIAIVLTEIVSPLAGYGSLEAAERNSDALGCPQMFYRTSSVGEYDPHAGLDSDGRIPQVPLPDGLPNPDRWRYIPEGRIKPGNIFERFAISTFILPIFFYEADIGAGGGVSITDIDFREKRRREFAGMYFTYTTEGQQRYRMVWQRWLNHQDLQGGGVILEERSYLRIRGGYTRTLTRRFFGGDETSYTEEITEAAAIYQVSVPDPGDDLIVHLGISAEHHNLARGRVRGRPTTGSVFPGEVEYGDDFDILWFDGLLRYDTRDSQHAPYRGGTIELGMDSAPLMSKGKQAAIYSLNGSWIFPVPGLFHNGGRGKEENPPTDVIAFGAKMEWADGDLPFWALPTLGGKDTLRGYIENRFTGRALWHGAAEYRFWTLPRGFALTEAVRIERLGAALFYELGTVSDGMDHLWTEKIHDSYGLSLRFSLERTAQFRADFGFSDEGMNVTFGYGLSF